MQFERPNGDEIQLVFDLLTRSDITEYGDPDSELSDLRDEWSRMDLSLDAWVVRDDDNARVVGYGAVIPSEDSVRFDIYVDPDQADAGTAADLLSRCEKRVQGLVDKIEVIGRTYLAHVNLQSKELFTEAGFEYVKSYYQFHIDLQTDLDDPTWPESVSMRTAVQGDDERIYQAVQTAFERSEDQAPTYKQWRTYMIRPDIFDPELWFLAEVNGEIVGASLGIKYETEGWIRQLGVIPTWRGKGIATALLRQSFLKFRERGYERVGLGMEAKNEKALNLYKRVGMNVRRQYDEYCKVYTP